MTFRRDSGIPVGGILEFADAEEIKRRSSHPVCRVSFCVFVWSLARRSSHRLCRPEATRRQEGQAVKRKNGFLSDRGGLRIQEKTPHATAAKVSSLRSGSVPEPAAQEPHTSIRSWCGSKNTGSCFRFVSSCSRVQRPGVHRRHRRWQGASPTRYRTDRGKSEKRQILDCTTKR